MFRAVDRWLVPYLVSAARRPARAGLRHLVFCLADHFEPFRGGVSPDEARGRVRRWASEYGAAVNGLVDADAKPMAHTFFFPVEEYDEVCLDALSGLQRAGLGEVEVHLHHRNDTAVHLAETLRAYTGLLASKHGVLGCDAAGVTRYGFIHGNWALGNSRPDGDWCGVNNELSVLAETGCYADFTFPSAPSPTQPCVVNAIYRAKDTGSSRPADRGQEVRSVWHGDPVVAGVPPAQEREDAAGDSGYYTGEQSMCSRRCPTGAGAGEEPLGTAATTPDSGARGEAGASPVGVERHCSSRRLTGGIRGGTPSDGTGREIQDLAGRGLMLITGPLALDWRRRKWGVLPRIENSEVSDVNPATPGRLRLWARQGIHVRGRPDWIFVKTHCHGCASESLPGRGIGALARMLKAQFDDGARWRLHWVTAREMYNIARAAEDGHAGDPGKFRDYEVTLRQV